jgi:hypothetical protein
MRRLLIVGMLLALPTPAVIVDRVAVAAGNRIITASEIDLRIRLTAFQNGETPDFGIASRKRATELLIDQRIVEREMDDGHYPRLTEEMRKRQVANYKPGLRKLAAYGLTEADLEEDLARQTDVLTFLNLRFRVVDDKVSGEHADADMNAWIREQRKRTKIVYLEKELVP